MTSCIGSMILLFITLIGILSAHIFVAALEISLYGISHLLSSSLQLKNLGETYQKWEIL